MKSLNRIYVGEQIDQKLRQLKGKTGLSPNLLCRIGFCLSLEEPGIPDVNLYSGGREREFNRFTLTGQWDTLFFSLLRERLILDGMNAEQFIEEQFIAHISRGVSLLAQRTKRVEDLLEAIPVSGVKE
jgi:DNA sulfur modification protein DndE